LREGAGRWFLRAGRSPLEFPAHREFEDRPDQSVAAFVEGNRTFPPQTFVYRPLASGPRVDRIGELGAHGHSHDILVLDEQRSEHRALPRAVDLIAPVIGLVATVDGRGTPGPVARGNVMAKRELRRAILKPAPLARLAGKGVAQPRFLDVDAQVDLHALQSCRVEI